MSNNGKSSKPAVRNLAVMALALMPIGTFFFLKGRVFVFFALLVLSLCAAGTYMLYLQDLSDLDTFRDDFPLWRLYMRTTLALAMTMTLSLAILGSFFLRAATNSKNPDTIVTMSVIGTLFMVLSLTPFPFVRLLSYHDMKMIEHHLEWYQNVGTPVFRFADKHPEINFGDLKRRVQDQSQRDLGLKPDARSWEEREQALRERLQKAKKERETSLSE